MFKIHVHHHWPHEKEILDSLHALHRKVDYIMRTLDEFKAAIAKIDAETTRIAAKIDDLIAQLQTQGLTDSEEQQVFDDLGAVADRLRTVGADPDNPVPPSP